MLQCMQETMQETMPSIAMTCKKQLLTCLLLGVLVAQHVFEEWLSELGELFGYLCVEEDFKRGVQANNDLETKHDNGLNQMN